MVEIAHADLSALALESDPVRAYENLRRFGEIAWSDALESWVVTSRALALEILGDDARFTVDDERMSVRVVLGRNMLTTDGSAHLRFRRPFAPVFRRRAIEEALSDLLQREAELLAARIASREVVDLRTAFAAPLALRGTIAVLGLDELGEAETLARLAELAAGMTRAELEGEQGAEAAAAFAGLRRELLQHLEAVDPPPSLLRELARRATGLTGDELIDDAVGVLFGGVGAAETLLLNTLLLLLTHAAECSRVRSEPDLLNGAIEESLRLQPPAATLERFAVETVELGGARIEEGQRVTILVGAANRDPRHFAHPHRFDPTRPNVREHLSFAHGPHTCVGMHLGRLEARIGLAVLLRAFPRMRLAPGDVRAAGAVFRKPKALLVELGSAGAARPGGGPLRRSP